MPVTELKQIVNKDVVRCLEDILEMAKNGEVQAVAIAGVGSDSNGLNVYSGDWYPIHLLGELSILQREIMDSNIDLRSDMVE